MKRMHFALGSLGPTLLFMFMSCNDTGTDEGPTMSRVYTSGPLAVVVDTTSGDIRSVRYNGAQMCSGIKFSMRDSSWGTADNRVVDDKALSHRDVGCDDNGDDDDNTLAYTVHLGRGSSAPVLQVRLTLQSDDTEGNAHVTVDAECTFPSGVRTRRCGFVVLHPLALVRCVMTCTISLL